MFNQFMNQLMKVNYDLALYTYILLCAIITGICAYTFYVKEYKREKTALKFHYWMEVEDIYEKIYVLSLFWVPSLLLFIIIYPLKKIIERINKHYDID